MMALDMMTSCASNSNFLPYLVLEMTLDVTHKWAKIKWSRDVNLRPKLTSQQGQPLSKF